MPKGYLVSLGDTSLDNGDVISGAYVTFTTDTNLGPSSWTWSGVAGCTNYTNEVGLSALSDPAREELFALFPELRSNIGGYGQTARRCLKRHETELLNV